MSLIVDPRHKYDCFDNSSWEEAIKFESIEKLEKMFKSKYYTASDTKEPQVNEKRNLMANILGKSKKKEHWKNEILKYLNMPSADLNSDILKWWKENCAALPNLSKMARDILAIPAASGFFSSGSLIMCNKRT